MLSNAHWHDRRPAAETAAAEEQRSWQRWKENDADVDASDDGVRIQTETAAMLSLQLASEAAPSDVTLAIVAHYLELRRWRMFQSAPSPLLNSRWINKQDKMSAQCWHDMRPSVYYAYSRPLHDATPTLTLTLIFDILSWNLAHLLLLLWGTFTPILFFFLRILVFELGAGTGTDTIIIVVVVVMV